MKNSCFAALSMGTLLVAACVESGPRVASSGVIRTELCDGETVIELEAPPETREEAPSPASQSQRGRTRQMLPGCIFRHEGSIFMSSAILTR